MELAKLQGSVEAHQKAVAAKQDRQNAEMEAQRTTDLTEFKASKTAAAVKIIALADAIYDGPISEIMAALSAQGRTKFTIALHRRVEYNSRSRESYSRLAQSGGLDAYLKSLELGTDPSVISQAVAEHLVPPHNCANAVCKDSVSAWANPAPIVSERQLSAFFQQVKKQFSSGCLELNPDTFERVGVGGLGVLVVMGHCAKRFHEDKIPVETKLSVKPDHNSPAILSDGPDCDDSDWVDMSYSVTASWDLAQQPQ